MLRNVSYEPPLRPLDHWKVDECALGGLMFERNTEFCPLFPDDLRLSSGLVNQEEPFFNNDGSSGPLSCWNRGIRLVKTKRQKMARQARCKVGNPDCTVEFDWGGWNSLKSETGSLCNGLHPPNSSMTHFLVPVFWTLVSLQNRPKTKKAQNAQAI